MAEPYDMSYREGEHGQTPATAPHSRGVVMADGMRRISRWIDSSPANAARDPEALIWVRVAKAGEEVGEAIDAMNEATNANPRKEGGHGYEKVIQEMLDVACSALGAVEHLTGNEGRSIALLEAKIASVVERAGLTNA